MNQRVFSPVVLIGEAENYFDEKFQPTMKMDLKFLIIGEVGSTSLQFLLMEPNHPHEIHAQALLEYMKTNKLVQIMVYGGGKLRFYIEQRLVRFSDRSYSFGIPSESRLIELSKSIWPDSVPAYSLDTAAPLVPDAGENYTRSEIEEIIEVHLANNK